MKRKGVTVTFDQARDIVARDIDPGWPGRARSAVPGGIALVDKRTGLLTLTTYLEDRERLDAMTPVGEAESTSE